MVKRRSDRRHKSRVLFGGPLLALWKSRRRCLGLEMTGLRKVERLFGTGLFTVTVDEVAVYRRRLGEEVVRMNVVLIIRDRCTHLLFVRTEY